MDEKEQIRWVNREWTRVLGWSLEEMQQPERFLAFSPYAIVEGEEERGDASLRRPALGWRDFKLTVKDGRVLDLSWATVRLSDRSVLRIGDSTTLEIRQAAIVPAGKRILLDLKSGKWETWDPFKESPRGHNIYDVIADSQNNAYFTDIGREHIGRIDAKTGKVTMFETPTKSSGPRRGWKSRQSIRADLVCCFGVG